MAATTLRFDLVWENGVSVILYCKENSEDVITIVEMEENGCIADLWDSLAEIMEHTFASAVKRAGDEMKS